MAVLLHKGKQTNEVLVSRTNKGSFWLQLPHSWSLMRYGSKAVWKARGLGEDTDKSYICSSNHAMWCGLCPFFLPAISIRKANSKKTNTLMCSASSMLSPVFSTSMSVSLAWWVPSMEAPLAHLSYRGGDMFHEGFYRLEWEIGFQRLAISPSYS